MPTRPEFYWSEARQQYRKRKKIDGIRRDFWGNTKEDVRRQIAAAAAASEAGLIHGDTTTVYAYAIKWLPLATTGLTPGGKKDYENAINTHILPLLGNERLRDLKPLHVDQLLHTMEGKSRSLRSKVFHTLRKLLGSAKENGLVAVNVALEKKPGGKKAVPKTPLTASQSAVLIEAVKDTRAEVFVALGLWAGLRREEILGLAWSDVHFGDTPYLEVTHAVRFDKSTPIRSPQLKTPAAARKIPMPPELTETLRRQKRKIAEGKAPASFLVVPDSRGELCSLNAMRKLWELVERREDDGEPVSKHSPKMFKVEKTLDFHVTPHLLRHTYITTLCASGMDIKKIQYLAGHESVEMTLNIYTKVVGNKPEDMYEAVKDAFKKPEKQQKSERK